MTVDPMDLSPAQINAISPEDAPFAVMLVANDSIWRSEKESCALVVRSLLEKGARYFVCIGENSEEAHDLVDDLVIDLLPGEVIITTFCNDGEIESDMDAFKCIAMQRMARGFIVNVSKESLTFT